MANSALCGGTAKNLGQPTTICVLKRPSKLCFQAQTANDGTKNSILTSDTVNDTYIKGMIQTGDKTGVSVTDDASKRWFPTSTLKGVSDVREDQNTEEIDGFEYVVSQGVRTVSFMVVQGASPELFGAFMSRANLIDSFYTWSIDEQIGGNGRTAGELKPFRIEKGTMKVTLVKDNKADETSQKINVSFALSDSEKDEDIAFLAPGDGCIDSGVNVTDYEGLIDVTMTVDSNVVVTATEFTVDLAYIYGSQAKKSSWTGAVLGDFTFAGVAPTSVTESATEEGKYAFVVPTFSGTQTLTMFREGVMASPITVTLP